MNIVSLTINGFEVKVAFDENSIHIYNAFPIKEDLKIRGYRWNPAEKTWYNDRGDIQEELSILRNNLKPLADKAEIPDLLEKDHTIAQKDPLIPESSSVSELRNRIQRVISESVGGNIWVRNVNKCFPVYNR